MISRPVGDEFVIIDRATQVAHSLAGVHAAVWRAVAQDEAVTWPGADDEVAQAVVDLQRRGLLQVSGLDRRAVIGRAGKVGGLVVAANVGAVALPSGLASLILPDAAAATSQDFTQGTGGVYSKTVPAGVIRIQATMTGAGGGGKSRVGGSGHVFTANITATTGTLAGLNLNGVVGAGGQTSGTVAGTDAARGGMSATGAAGGGGTTLNLGGSLVAVAAGGGGGGSSVGRAEGTSGGGSGPTSGGSGGNAGSAGQVGQSPISANGGAGGAGAADASPLVGGGAGGTAAGTTGTAQGAAGAAGGPTLLAPTPSGVGGGGGQSTGTAANASGVSGGGGGGGFHGGGGGGAGAQYYAAPTNIVGGAGGGGGGGSSFPFNTTPQAVGNYRITLLGPPAPVVSGTGAGGAINNNGVDGSLVIQYFRQ